MQKTQTYIYSLGIVSGILLGLSWHPFGLPYLLLIAFFPLLMLERHEIEGNIRLLKNQVIRTYYRSEHRHIRFAEYLAFVIFNAITTWWVWNATALGTVGMILANSLLMYLTFRFFKHLHRLLVKIAITHNKPVIYAHAIAYILLPIIWLAFEYGHHRWDLSWPWLTLGNAFASHPYAVQWYEYTGILGGSLWVWWANTILFETLLFYKPVQGDASHDKSLAYRIFYWVPLILIIVVPIAISVVQYNNYRPTKPTHHAVIVQQNTDVWHEYEIPTEDIINNINTLARPHITNQTQLLLVPESALLEYTREPFLLLTNIADSLQSLYEQYPRLTTVIGMSSSNYTEGPERPTPTARPYSNGYIDYYNTALLYSNRTHYKFRHKSRLVPGVESLPFPQFFNALSIDLGGISGSLTPDPSPVVLVTKNQQLKLATLICYESIYGDYTTQFVKQGANLITIITNDGWWKKTPGHRQHFALARLRAIETRRDVLRAANTGISGYINQRGDVVTKTAYGKPAALSVNVALNTKQTFYTQHGDYLGRISLFITIVVALLIYLLTLVAAFVKK